MTRSISFATLLALSGLACSRPAPGPVETVVRDSAGIRVVENSTTAMNGAPLRVLGAPVYRVGWAGSGIAFAQVSAGVILDGGRVVVGDQLGHVLVSLSPSGEETARFGHEGDGPGEFRFLYNLVRSDDDGVTIQDMSLGRLTTFSGAGELRGSVSLPLSPDAGPRMYRLRGTLPSGRLLMAPGAFNSGRAAPRDSLGWIHVPVLAWDAATGRSDTLAIVGAELRPVVEGRAVSPPFALRGFTAAADSSWVYARADLAEVTWREMDGRVLQIARWPEKPTPLDEEAGRDVIDQQVERMEASPEGGPERARRFRRTLEDQFANGDVVAPLFESVAAEPNGTVWLDEHTGDHDAAQTFRLIGPDGAFLGRVQTPPRFWLLDVRDGFVLGIERDALDVQAVSLYRMADLTEVPRP